MKRFFCIILSCMIIFTNFIGSYQKTVEAAPVAIPIAKGVVIKILQKLAISGCGALVYHKLSEAGYLDSAIENFKNNINDTSYKNVDNYSIKMAIKIAEMVGKGQSFNLPSGTLNSSVLTKQMAVNFPQNVKFGVSQLPSAKQTDFLIKISNGITVNVHKKDGYWHDLSVGPFITLHWSGIPYVSYGSYTYFEIKDCVMTFSDNLKDEGNNEILSDLVVDGVSSAFFNRCRTLGYTFSITDVQGAVFPNRYKPDSIPNDYVEIPAVGVSSGYFQDSVAYENAPNFFNPSGGNVVIKKSGEVAYQDEVFNPDFSPEALDALNYEKIYPDLFPKSDVVNPPVPGTSGLTAEQVQNAVKGGIDSEVFKSGVAVGVETGIIKGLPSVLGDWLSQLINSLKELFITLFVPSAEFFDTWKNTFFNNFNSRIGFQDSIVKLENLSSVNGDDLRNLTINLDGKEVTVVDFSFLKKVKPVTDNMLRGVFFILLVIFNINQAYKLIRGTNLVDSSNTINNMNMAKVSGTPLDVSPGTSLTKL